MFSFRICQVLLIIDLYIVFYFRCLFIYWLFYIYHKVFEILYTYFQSYFTRNLEYTVFLAKRKSSQIASFREVLDAGLIYCTINYLICFVFPHDNYVEHDTMKSYQEFN